MTTSQDLLKWFIVSTLICITIWGNWYYSELSLFYRVVAVVVFAAIALAVALQTEKGIAFSELLREARIEMLKVVWPTKEETTQTTLVVLGVVFVISIILWGVDSLLGWFVGSLIG